MEIKPHIIDESSCPERKCNKCDKFRCELQQYHAIGTVKECETAREKMKPKKPQFNGANWYRCPSGCEVHKHTLETDYFCPNCGQAIDWSE